MKNGSLTKFYFLRYKGIDSWFMNNETLISTLFKENEVISFVWKWSEIKVHMFHFYSSSGSAKTISMKIPVLKLWAKILLVNQIWVFFDPQCVWNRMLSGLIFCIWISINKNKQHGFVWSRPTPGIANEYVFFNPQYLLN